ncbi:hypothetical protein ACIQWV_38820 [Streptomyces sp. NPDC098085]|uniref:hypothetical protein n=1 Tax=Streptomyces sp. NPDC098085 TaxID=3366094 RepID=UPI00381C7CB6
MIPADANELVTSKDIEDKYKVTDANVAYWVTLDGFPEGWPSGPGRTLVRDATRVDEWLRENLPVYWAQGQNSDNPYDLPDGGPKDLVKLSDICAWEGKALGRKEPVPEGTLRSYMSKKPPKMPGPDRTPGDGQRPEVTERMWFRKTAYDFVNRPRRMRRQKKSEDQAVAEQAPAAPGASPSRASIARTGHDAQSIATTYCVSGQTARGWTRVEGFPEARYNAAEVDEWVRHNSRRTWNSAQRRAELTDQARAGSPAADSDNPYVLFKGGPKDLVKLAEQAAGVLPSHLSTARRGHIDAQGIATTYNVTRQTASGWTRIEGFPEARYNAAEVDEWVRHNRRPSWNSAQRRAELTDQTRAGSRAADSASEAQGDQAEPTQALEPAPDAPGEQAELSAEMIGPRYGVSEHTGLQWTKAEDKQKVGKIIRRAFPAPLRTRPRVYDQHMVDLWVKEHRPHVWAAFKGTGPALLNPLPEGDPLDLLDIYDFAEVVGMATRGEPLARETIASYHSRGQIPFADRTPEDGKEPKVLQDHWYRRTVYEFVLSRRGSGNFDVRESRA